MCTGQRLKIRITKYILLPTAEANDVGNGAVQGWDSLWGMGGEIVLEQI